MSFLTEYFGLCEGEGEQAVCCPFPHSLSDGTQYFETRPSAYVNTDSGLFHCMACDTGLNEAQFIMKTLGCDYEAMSKIKRCFNNTEDRATWLEETSLSDESRARAKSYNISDEVIQELNLATPDMTKDLLSFPVFMFDHLVDIRTYNPGYKPKVRSREGCPAGLIIPFDVWRESPVTKWTILCAGEKDMAVTRSHKLNAITLTGGEGITPLPINYFKDRKVAICYDNDGPGINGAKKLARVLSEYAAEVKVVTNFHEVCKEEHEDLTDFFNKYGKTREDLIQYINSTPVYNPDTDVDFKPKYPLMNLLEASKAQNVNRMIKTNIQVVSVAEDTYACPSIVVAEKFNMSNNGTDTMAVGEIRQWELKSRIFRMFFI